MGWPSCQMNLAGILVVAQALERRGGIFVNEPCVVDGNIVSGCTWHAHGPAIGEWKRMLRDATDQVRAA